jgi:Fe-S metabolism associated domain
LESAVIRQQAAISSRDIVETQRRIIEEFDFVPSLSEPYETLIEFGRRLAPMPMSLRVDRNRIRNCHGQAWLAGVRRDGRLFSARRAKRTWWPVCSQSSSRSIPVARPTKFFPIR